MARLADRMTLEEFKAHLNSLRHKVIYFWKYDGYGRRSNHLKSMHSDFPPTTNPRYRRR